MRQRRADEERRRAQEFESFVAGAAGRLLHVAVLLTGEPPGDSPRALRLLTAALAATYADWHRLRGEDPYDRARQELATGYARSAAWRMGRTRDGVLGPLSRQERLTLVLRLYEGADEERTAALMGLPVERVRALCARGVGTMRAREHAGRAARAAATGRRGPAAGPASGPAVAP